MTFYVKLITSNKIKTVPKSGIVFLFCYINFPMIVLHLECKFNYNYIFVGGFLWKQQLLLHLI